MSRVGVRLLPADTRRFYIWPGHTVRHRNVAWTPRRTLRENSGSRTLASKLERAALLVAPDKPEACSTWKQAGSMFYEGLAKRHHETRCCCSCSSGYCCCGSQRAGCLHCCSTTRRAKREHIGSVPRDAWSRSHKYNQTKDSPGGQSSC